MPSLLTGGLGLAPYAPVTGGLTAVPVVPGPPALLVGGLGFAPFTLVVRGLGAVTSPTPTPTPGPPALLTGGLGFAPFTLVVRGLGAVTTPTPTPTPTPTAAPYRDAPLLDLIAAAIDDTREFDLVTTAGLPEFEGVGADEDRVAVVGRNGKAREVDSLGSNSDGSVTQVRTVPFRVTLIVRHPSPTKRDDELDRLAQVVMNVVNGRSFGGATAPTMTWLREGEDEKPNGVERRNTLSGAFTYFIPSWGGRSEV